MSLPIHTAAGDIHISNHAVERYVERVKPALAFGNAKRELAILLPQADLSLTVPDWLGENPETTTHCWLVLCDSIAFPVFGTLVTTVIARGTFGPVQRQTRSAQHRWRRRVKRTIETKERSTGARRQRKAQTKRQNIDYGEAA